jgi:hypothetical protein
LQVLYNLKFNSFPPFHIKAKFPVESCVIWLIFLHFYFSSKMHISIFKVHSSSAHSMCIVLNYKWDFKRILQHFLFNFFFLVHFHAQKFKRFRIYVQTSNIHLGLHVWKWFSLYIETVWSGPKICQTEFINFHEILKYSKCSKCCFLSCFFSSKRAYVYNQKFKFKFKFKFKAGLCIQSLFVLVLSSYLKHFLCFMYLVEVG